MFLFYISFFSLSQDAFTEEKILWTCPNNKDIVLTYRMSNYSDAIELNGPLNIDTSNMIVGNLKISDGSFDPPKQLTVHEILTNNLENQRNNQIKEIIINKPYFSEQILYYNTKVKPLPIFDGTCNSSKKVKNINPVFKIKIERKISGKSCTQGYFSVNDKIIAYTLELPDLNNQKNISSIPKGIYSAFVRNEGNKGWRIELRDVPGRENVQIHVGNYTNEIKGCILIGTKVDLNNCSVLNNYEREAINKLRDIYNELTKELILDDNHSVMKPLNVEVEISGI